MPYLTSLADVARGAGLKVVEQAGWKTRGHGAQTGVKTIVCHHTGTTNATANAPSLGTVQNGRPDLAGPLSHFVLGRDGTVFVVAAGQCWHAGDTWQAAQSNAYAIGIEAEGTGYAAWPEVQMDAYARLCRALCAAFGLGADRVQGHKEICSPTGRKTDPNFDMAAFRGRVVNSKPTPTVEELMKLAEPRDLEQATDWKQKTFAVEVGSNSSVVASMWFTLVTAWGGSTDYEVGIWGDGGVQLKPANDVKAIGTLQNNGNLIVSIPSGARIVTLKYRNNGPALAGCAFPQVSK